MIAFVLNLEVEGYHQRWGSIKQHAIKQQEKGFDQAIGMRASYNSLQRDPPIFTGVIAGYYTVGVAHH